MAERKPFSGFPIWEINLQKQGDAKFKSYEGVLLGSGKLLKAVRINKSESMFLLFSNWGWDDSHCKASKEPILVSESLDTCLVNTLNCQKTSDIHVFYQSFKI